MFTATEYEMNYYLRVTPGRYYICIWKMEDFKKMLPLAHESVIHSVYLMDSLLAFNSAVVTVCQ